MDSGYVNQCKEDFSEAYVRSVAAAAGCWLDRRSRDYDGIDAMITRYGNTGTYPDAPLNMQLKGAHDAAVDEEAVRYDLSVNNYDKLRIKRSTAPSVLVLVIVPDDPADWIEQDEVDLHMLRAGYWMDLLGEPATANRTTKRISIPRSQLLTVAELRRIMNLVAEDRFP
jgi:hypothetical protein